MNLASLTSSDLYTHSVGELQRILLRNSWLISWNFPFQIHMIWWQKFPTRWWKFIGGVDKHLFSSSGKFSISSFFPVVVLHTLTRKPDTFASACLPTKIFPYPTAEFLKVFVILELVAFQKKFGFFSHVSNDDFPMLHHLIFHPLEHNFLIGVGLSFFLRRSDILSKPLNAHFEVAEFFAPQPLELVLDHQVTCKGFPHVVT